MRRATGPITFKQLSVKFNVVQELEDWPFIGSFCSHWSSGNSSQWCDYGAAVDGSNDQIIACFIEEVLDGATFVAHNDSILYSHHDSICCSAINEKYLLFLEQSCNYGGE